MAKPLPASEFGGTTQRNTIAPPVTPLGHPGHQWDELTAAEKLRLQYLTGQPGDVPQDTTADPDTDGDAWNGTLPRAEQEEFAPKPPLYSERFK